MPATITIDLGASYTKVALLEYSLDTRTYTAQTLKIDGADTIPSCAFEEAPGRYRFGQTNASRVPGANQNLILNWKKALYGQSHDAAAHAILQAFLTWLVLETFEKVPVGLHATWRTDIQFVIAIPNLDNPNNAVCEKIKASVRAAFAKAKITGPVHLCFEPIGNALGILTKGQNRVNRHGEVISGEMVDADIREIVAHPENRAAARTTQDKPYRPHFLIVDIGSFTTDFSVTTLDAFLNPKIVHQKSYPLGTYESIAAKLRKEPRFAELSWTSFDTALRDIVAHVRKNPHVPHPVYIKESAVVGQAIKAFITELKQAHTDFCQEAKLKAFTRTYLTGGGVHFLSDSHRESLFGNITPTELRLLTHATSLGGCSVILSGDLLIPTYPANQPPPANPASVTALPEAVLKTYLESKAFADIALAYRPSAKLDATHRKVIETLLPDSPWAIRDQEGRLEIMEAFIPYLEEEVPARMPKKKSAAAAISELAAKHLVDIGTPVARAAWTKVLGIGAGSLDEPGFDALAGSLNAKASLPADVDIPELMKKDLRDLPTGKTQDALDACNAKVSDTCISQLQEAFLKAYCEEAMRKS